MRESTTRLKMALETWRQWAEAASCEEDGWESDARNWGDLMAHSQQLLVEKDLRPEDISLLETAFSISEEDEPLADFLKANYEEVPRETIQRLSSSSHPHVRWQVYDSLVTPDEFSRRLLEAGIQDPDDYVRRRAFLRLLSMQRPTHSALERAANDTDAVIREQAKKLLT
jgi:hypothetical protein